MQTGMENVLVKSPNKQAKRQPDSVCGERVKTRLKIEIDIWELDVYENIKRCY